MRGHAHHGAVHARRWVKAGGRHKQHVFHGVAPLQHHRQPAVVAGRGRSHHAVYDLFLQHEVLVLHHISHLQQMKKNGGGNVVRQVANDAQTGGAQARGQGPEVDLEHVRLHHFQLRVGAQLGGQIAVQLDDRQPPQPLDQRLCEGGQARADFHHGLAWPGIYGANNLINDAAVGQKMLTKALAGDVLQGQARLIGADRGIRRRRGRASPAEKRAGLLRFFLRAAHGVPVPGGHGLTAAPRGAPARQ